MTKQSLKVKHNPRISSAVVLALIVHGGGAIKINLTRYFPIDRDLKHLCHWKVSRDLVFTIFPSKRNRFKSIWSLTMELPCVCDEKRHFQFRCKCRSLISMRYSVPCPSAYASVILIMFYAIPLTCLFVCKITDCVGIDSFCDNFSSYQMTNCAWGATPSA